MATPNMLEANLNKNSAGFVSVRQRGGMGKNLNMTFAMSQRLTVHTVRLLKDHYDSKSKG